MMLQFKNGVVSVGDVFCSSWGYEQTNISYYQVVATRGKITVILQEIGRSLVHVNGYDRGTVKPHVGHFISDKLITRRVRDFSDCLSVKIESFEYAYQCSPNETHDYTSYY